MHTIHVTCPECKEKRTFNIKNIELMINKVAKFKCKNCNQDIKFRVRKKQGIE